MASNFPAGTAVASVPATRAWMLTGAADAFHVQDSPGAGRELNIFWGGEKTVGSPSSLVLPRNNPSGVSRIHSVIHKRPSCRASTRLYLMPPITSEPTTSL